MPKPPLRLSASGAGAGMEMGRSGETGGEVLILGFPSPAGLSRFGPRVQRHTVDQAPVCLSPLVPRRDARVAGVGWMTYMNCDHVGSGGNLPGAAAGAGYHVVGRLISIAALGTGTPVRTLSSGTGGGSGWWLGSSRRGGIQITWPA